MLLIVAPVPLLPGTFNESLDLLGPPDRCARADFDGLGVTTCAAAFPPRALADGDEFHDLRKTKKTS